MLIGDLHDLLMEKLSTGEFSRLDVICVSDGCDDENCWTIDDLSKINGDFVRIESASLNEDMESLYLDAAAGRSAFR